MTSKIEEVARAIYDEQREHEGVSITWEEAISGEFEFPNYFLRVLRCRAEARAAIKAMREPTEAMMGVGGLKCETLMFDGEGSGVIFTDMGVVFAAMIEAALQEEGE